MPQTRRVVKNSSYLVIAQIPVQAANAVYVLILAQRLGVSEFGRFATLWALLAFFQTVIEQGLGRSITRDLASRKFSIADSVAHGLILALGMGFVSVGAMTGIGWTLSAVLGHAPDFVMLAFVTGASLVPRAIWVTVSAVFNAQQRIGVSAVLSVIGSLSNAALGLVALFAGLGLLGVLVASAIAQTFPMVVAFMLMFRLIWPGDADISRKTLVTMGRSAMPFVVRALLGIVYFRADLLLLTTFVSFEAAGVYQAAYKVLELALVLPGAANSAAYPVISAYLANNRARAARAYQRLLGGMFAIGLPLSVLLFVGANPLVNLLYGQAYSAAAPMLTILAGAILLSYVNAAPIIILAASARQTAFTVVTACGLAVNLAVNALLIPTLHGQGASLAMIASEAAQCLLLFALTARILRGVHVEHTPEVVMLLGFVLSGVLVYAPQIALGRTLGAAWLLAIPGLVVYLIGVALYGRTILADRAFGASSGAWEIPITQLEADVDADAKSAQDQSLLKAYTSAQLAFSLPAAILSPAAQRAEEEQRDGGWLPEERSSMMRADNPTTGVLVLDPATPQSEPKQASNLRHAHVATRLRSPLVISLVIFALSLSVGAYQALTNSIWLDEAYAVGLSQLRWATLWSYLWGIEAHMGFYYVVLRGWIWLMGLVGIAPTEFVIRLPSLFCIASSAVVVYQFGRRFLGDIAGVMGALLFLMNFLVLVQGNEAREYGLQTLCVCMSWYALVAALTDDGASRRWWVVYVVFGTLQIYAEVFSVLIFSAQVATFLCLLALGPAWRARVRRSAVPMAISVAVIFRLSTPILYDALLHGSGNGWISPAHLSDLAALLNPLGGGVELFVPLLLAIGLLELTVVLLAQAPFADWWTGASTRLNQFLGGHAPTLLDTSRSSAVPLAVIALICWFTLPILLAFAFTQPALNLHLFNYQYFAICAPAYCLLAALSVAVTRWRFAQVILAVVLIAFSLRVIPTARDSANYDAWRASALWLEQRYTPGDGIVCVPDTWCAIPMDYYLFAYPSHAHFDSDSPGAWNWQRQASIPTSPEALASYAAKHDRIFVVSYDRGEFGAASLQDQQRAAVKTWFSAHSWQASSFSASTYLSTITITMYIPTPTASALARLTAARSAPAMLPPASWRRESRAPGL